MQVKQKEHETWFLVVCAVTQLTALVKGNVPYYPIEMSRMAAADPTCAVIFTVGILLVMHSVYEQTHRIGLAHYLVALGSLGLFVPDNVQHEVHLVGVALMVLGTVLKGWPDPKKRRVCLIAILVYSTRLAAKGIVMYWATHGDLSLIDTIRLAKDVAMNGTSALPDQTYATEVLWTLRACAVAQWWVLVQLVSVWP